MKLSTMTIIIRLTKHILDKTMVAIFILANFMNISQEKNQVGDIVIRKSNYITSVYHINVYATQLPSEWLTTFKEITIQPIIQAIISIS